MSESTAENNHTDKVLLSQNNVGESASVTNVPLTNPENSTYERSSRDKMVMGSTFPINAIKSDKTALKTL